MSPKQKDIIKWVIERMLAHDDSITQELALTVEREARLEWGGQRIEYIAKSVERKHGPRPLLDSEARRAAFEAAKSDAPIAEVQQKTGLSRASIYRLLKSGPGEDA